MSSFSIARGSLPVPADSLMTFLFSTPLRAVPSPFSTLRFLHQRWQPAYRQSSFSILRGAAPPPPSFSLSLPPLSLSAHLGHRPVPPPRLPFAISLSFFFI